MEHSEEQSPTGIRLSRKSLAGLLYVLIALTMVGLIVSQASANYQWFATAANLELRISRVVYHPDNTTGFPNVEIQASLYNPSNYNRLTPTQAIYAVWANSTSEAFDPGTGSPEVGLTTAGLDQTIPASANLDISYKLPMLRGIATPLHTFLNNHNGTVTRDLVTFVQITVYFQSTYGKFTIPYCYRLPENRLIPVCPATIEPTSHGAGG